MSDHSAHIRHLVIGVGLALVGHWAHAQCPNNNTITIDGLVTPNCPGATVLPCMASGQYALVAVQTGYLYTFATCGGTPWDTQLTLYNNTGAYIAWNDDGCGLQSTITWTATFTGSVRVVLDEYYLGTSCLGFMDDCIALTIHCMPPVTTPMTNNECAGAIPLPVFQSCFMMNFTNAGASNSAAPPNPTCGFSVNARDIWFQFTTPANGRVLIEASRGSLINGVMQLYSGACGAMTAVQCHDNVSATNLMPRIDRRCNPLAGNTTYYIRFWGSGTTAGSFGICISSLDDGNPGADCAGGATVCSDQAISNNSNWTGCSADLNAGNQGCLGSGERQGSWYFFSPQATGTIAFTITPMVAGQPVAVDYDFAIWGPMSTIQCPPQGAPIRCSWAYPPVVPGFPNVTGFDTGLITGAGQNTEGAAGDGFVNSIVVGAAQVGQIYIMYVDNFSVSGQSFDLDWNLSTTGMLDCTVLPVDLLLFNATPVNNMVRLDWATGSESNSSHFAVERSSGSPEFTLLNTVPAQGEATGRTEYSVFDTDPLMGPGFYRLRQVDQDGTETFSHIVPVHFEQSGIDLEIMPNPATGTVMVRIGRPHADMAGYRLHDMQGRTLMQTFFGDPDRTGTFTIPLHRIPAGVYIFEVHSLEGIAMERAQLVVE